MSQQIAHNIESKYRTQDIRISDNVDFTAMLLSDRVLHGLQKNGFKKPSPIQLKAIPMGRCGFDLIIKAKSGTGKTAVFGIVALEMVNVKSNDLQILILAPTREIAVQIQQVLLTIGVEFKGLKVEYFIGGTKLDDDTSKLKNCHIAVGAPGRVKHLIKKGAMKLDSVRLFVLDEADKLMQHSYQADINFIYNKLSPRKQMIASSATYPDELDSFLAKYMTSPTHISPDREVPMLLGIKQFVSIVPAHLNVIQQMALKTDELVRILQTISFTQCVVFSNYQTRAESLSNNLKRLGWPAIHICGAQKQKDRLEAVDRLKGFKCRILSTTDLTARGIDAANVDLVVNYEVPYEAETYLHRMGRAGRYGAYGICITIATEGVEVEKLQKIIGNIGDGTLALAKYPTTENLPKDIWQCNVTDFAQLTAKVERKDASEPSTSKTDAQTSELLKSESAVMEEQIHSTSTEADIICKHESIYDGIKNDIIRVMAADKQVEMVDFVEKTLSDLNTEQAAITTQLKHQYGKVDACTLFENLVKQIDQTDENVQTETAVTQKPLVEQLKENSDQTIRQDVESMSGVEKILGNISEREEISKMNMKEKLTGLDSSSILDMLSKGVKFDEIIEKSECKKAKVNESIACDKDASFVERENEQFENEAKVFQENNIVNKNIALYNLAALLAGKQQTVNEECVTSIGHLLSIIQQEDVSDKSKIDLQTALTDVLNIKPTLQMDNNDRTEGEITMDEVMNAKQEILHEDVNGKIQCGCSENVFNDMYTCAVSEHDQDWTSSLCKKHAGAKDGYKENYNEQQEESEQMYDEYYVEEEYKSNDQTLYNAYSAEETDYNNSYNGEEDTIKTEYDEDLFVKAYEYALTSEIDENLIEYNTETTFTESMAEMPEACGYVAGHSYKNFSCKKTKKRKHTNNYDNKMAECMHDTTYTHENYESQYDYFDQLLTRSVPLLDNVQRFEKFFRKWQENVSAVRNYIQHDVYVKEMLRQNK